VALTGVEKVLRVVFWGRQLFRGGLLPPSAALLRDENRPLNGRRGKKKINAKYRAKENKGKMLIG
jgi:hypothetical protein